MQSQQLFLKLRSNSESFTWSATRRSPWMVEVWAMQKQLPIKYPQIGKSWRSNWKNLNTLFEHPPATRKAIDTTNVIESLNRVIRKATKRRKAFTTDDSAKKVIHLSIQEASKKWSMPIRNWKEALSRFMIFCEDRIADFI